MSDECAFMKQDAIETGTVEMCVKHGKRRELCEIDSLRAQVASLELKAQATWDTAIEEAGKEREVFITKDNILSMDRDMKIRKQMRNEIVQALQKLKAEAGR